jgi:hypothetical protein
MRRRLMWPLASVLASMVLGGVAQAAGPVEPPPSSTAPAQTDSDAMLGRLSQLADIVERTGALGVDRTEDGSVVVVVPASGSSTFSSSQAKAVGLDVEVRNADIELSDIAEIRAFANENFASSFFSPALGKVVVGTADKALGDLFGERYGAKVIVLSGLGEFASRTADYNDHWGGAWMHGDNGVSCTSGFSVLNASGQQRMVTAGHCFPYQTVVDSPSGDSFGHVTSRQWSPTTDIDAGLVGANGATMGPSIYRGNSTGYQADVKGAKDPDVGDILCESGARRNEQCGQLVQDLDGTLCDPTDPGFCIQHLIVAFGPAVCHGDSGGPLFAVVTGGVGIRGTVDGFAQVPDDQQDNEGCMESDGYGHFKSWYNYFESWGRIRDYFDVTVMKAS